MSHYIADKPPPPLTSRAKDSKQRSRGWGWNDDGLRNVANVLSHVVTVPRVPPSSSPRRMGSESRQVSVMWWPPVYIILRLSLSWSGEKRVGELRCEAAPCNSVESLVTASFRFSHFSGLAYLLSIRTTLSRVAFFPEWDWEDACPEPILFLSWSFLHGDTWSHELPTMSGVCVCVLAPCLEALTETRQGEKSKARTGVQPSPRNHIQLCFRILTPSRSSPDWDLESEQIWSPRSSKHPGERNNRASQTPR